MSVTTYLRAAAMLPFLPVVLVVFGLPRLLGDEEVEVLKTFGWLTLIGWPIYLPVVILGSRAIATEDLRTRVWAICALPVVVAFGFVLLIDGMPFATGGTADGESLLIAAAALCVGYVYVSLILAGLWLGRRTRFLRPRSAIPIRGA